MDMNTTTTCNLTTPTAETDEDYEHEQMSGALLTAETDILPRETSSAVIKHLPKPRRWHRNSLPKSGDLSETSLEVLERTHPIETTKPNTSLEALENAHHESQINIEPRVLTRNNDTSLRQRPSNTYTGTLSKIPLPLTSSDDFSSTHPSLVSLPPSLSEAGGSDESEHPISLFSECYRLYETNNFRLSRHFPHLKCVWSSSRHNKANITIFDYAGSALQDIKHLSTDFKSDNSAESENIVGSKLDECRQFICSNNSLSQVDTRLVVVEDLGPSLINILGATFDLSPEFFEEHLHRSRYGGFGSSVMPPSNWRTSNLQKNYVSFAWYRPGESWNLGMNQGEWKELLNLDCILKLTQCLDKSGQSKSVAHELRTKTNIFRRSSEMSTDPTGQLPDKVPCGLEERATMCNVEVKGVQYVILLLDPVPLSQETTAGVIEAMGPVKSLGKQGDENCKYCSIPTPINISEKRFRQIKDLSSFTQMQCRTPWTLDYRSLFSTKTAWPEILDQLSPFQSTVEAFGNWLVSAPASEVGQYNNRLGPGSMIFRIAHQDTMGLLQLMRSAVAEIDLASSDLELQETALHWRCRLDEFRAHLIDLEASFHLFVDFLHADAAARRQVSPPKVDMDPIEDLLYHGINEIEAQKQRITQVYSSLTSKTQISDSHRSIAEAETVTRLTELAFLFIPLSFATSIFGMQFISGSTSATTYIAVALALTSGSYFLRFIVDRTTEQRSELRRSTKNRITAYAGLRSGSRIPTATFLRWLADVTKRCFFKFWKWSFLGTTIIVILVIPLPIIWTSSLNMGLQIALSCLLISLPTFLVVFYFFARYVKQQRQRARGSSAP